MKVVRAQAVIEFSLERHDWPAGRADRFLFDIKNCIPKDERHYNPKTNWWMIDIKHQELFDMIKQRHFGPVAEQQSLFAVAA